MSKNFLLLKRNRYLFQFILFTLLLIGVTAVFQDSFYSEFGYKNYISHHLIIEILIVWVSFSIAMQTFLSTRFTHERRVILLGALFLVFGLLETFHALTYSDMPYFITEPNPNISLWFLIIPKLLLPIGFIVIYSVNPKPVGKTFRNFAFLFAGLFSALIVFYVYQLNMPLLLSEGREPTQLRNTLYILSIFLEFLAILVMLKNKKDSSREAVTIGVSFVYLIGSDLMFLSYNEFFDMYIFLAHILHLFAFILLFSEIYYSQVRLPFIKLHDALTTLADSEKKIKHMAYYDEETDLPNEHFLREDLHQDLKESSPPKALLVFGISRYQVVKDSLGKKFAQRLIRSVGERITTELKGQVPLYKLDEDRFAVYINLLKNQEELLAFAEELQETTMEPYMIDHFSITTRLTIGISISPQDTTELDDFIQFATFASYEAAKTQKYLAFYTLAMQKNREKRILLENDLKSALNSQLYLEYQPQLHLETGDIISVEALLRWNHPERGFIPPLEFIPIAEESGLIIPIGQWIMETACRDTVALREKTGKNISVAVNLSIGQLYQKDFVHVVKDILKKTGLPPVNLHLEITESMTMNTKQIIPILRSLKEIGVIIAIDDFGKEYSSLAYLKDFPLDILKIDRSFIKDILENEKDLTVVKMILSMAKHLQLRVIAEGIENVEQLECLVKHQCDIIQGYYISKPMQMAMLEDSFESIQRFAKENIDI